MAIGSPMPGMAPAPRPPRTSGVFSGLLLIVFGALMLLHNYGHLSLSDAFGRWWGLIFVFWGVTKLYERTLAQRQGRTSGWITPGEVFLVLGLLTVVGLVVAWDKGKKVIGDELGVDFDWGTPYTFPIDLPSQTIPANAHISIRGGRGNVTLRSSDEATLRLAGEKAIRALSEGDAEKRASSVSVGVTQSGDSYEVRPTGFDLGDSRVSVNMDVVVPKKAAVTVRTERGEIAVSDMLTDVGVSTRKGDIEVNDTTGNVSVDTNGGDVKVSDTKGDVKVAGRGGDIEAVNATGSLVVDGEFFGSIRADKIAKGVRFVSQHTDLTLTQLGGHFEKGPGNLEITDAPGNLTSRTKNASVSLENVTGKIVLDNTNGPVEVRFSSPPKEDVTINNVRALVTLLLPAGSNFEIQADCHSCDINSEFSGGSLNQSKTEKGDSHLDGKYGAGRGPKIILKTSYDSIEIRKTN
jgi:Putative adhesin